MKLNNENSRSRKAAAWQEHIASWKQSGTTQKAYCTENSLNLSTFYYWRKKFSHRPSDISLLPVQVIKEEPIMRSSGVSLFLKNGDHIQVEEDFNPIALRQLISVLEKR